MSSTETSPLPAVDLTQVDANHIVSLLEAFEKVVDTCQPNTMLSSSPPRATSCSLLVLFFCSPLCFAIHQDLQLLQTTQGVSVVAVASKRPLTLLGPFLLLVKPVTTQKLPDASVIWLLLWRLERNKTIKIFVNGSRVTGAAVGG